MDQEKRINIVNGSGTSNIVNGTYNVTSEVEGYNNTTIEPNNIEIKDGVTTYNFTIDANGKRI